jgi:hypothetical protein
MLSETVDNRKDPFFTAQRHIKLMHKFMVDMKHLRNPKKLALIRINADILFLFVYLNVKQRQGVYDHIAREGIRQVVGIGKVVVLHFILQEDLPILLFVLLGAVGPRLKKLQNLRRLDLVNFVSWVRGMYCRF